MQNCWIKINENSDFSIYNIPFGIFSRKGAPKRVATRIGDLVLDLRAVAEIGLFKDLSFDSDVLENEFLNDFISLGKETTSKCRDILISELTNDQSKLRRIPDLFFPVENVEMHLPVRVGDYTDFFSSIEHATNTGSMFRDPKNALLPNWRHLPVGYHGRSSSIVVSGTPLHRPYGQTMPKDADKPVYGPSTRVDFELEMAFIIGKESKLGDPISTEAAPRYIFGMVLFNDWSARDIQKWEYVPLGPFLGKNFGSSISPWIVTIEALEPYKVAGPIQKPEVLPYLQCQGLQNYDIRLAVSIQANGVETIISRSNYKYMYWNMSQQLAHHTVNGCNVKVGDMMASGTISGKDQESYGSMLEISWAGSRSVKLNDGSERKFIKDHDTVVMKASAEIAGKRVGFGAVKSTILPAKES